MTMHIGKKNLISFFWKLLFPHQLWVRSALGAVFTLTSYSQLASGLRTDSYQSRLVKALLDTFTCSINLAFHHVPILRIMLSDYVWSDTEHKDLYCVFYRSAKQTFESVLIPGCTVSIFFWGLQNLIMSCMLSHFQASFRFLSINI